MDAERWRRIEEVFERALAQPTAVRARWLAEACPDDPALEREVASLLASDAGAATAIRQGVAREAHRAAVDELNPAGRLLGRYRLRALIGAGGMGAVYRADRDDATFAKQVAIKVLRHALGSPHAAARFRDERQMLAALEHRNIVRLLDGGSTEDGLPYLVMEHIEGLPITAYARQRGLSVRVCVQLVGEVCAALHHAHQNLIIHRDIKPSNILVDAAGTPKLLDFGIATLLAPAPGFDLEAQTRTGQVMFTPEYASPEQARGEAVSTATDVYSVGAVLYELLTGRPPQQPTGGAAEVVRAISEVEPTRPSLAAPPERRRELAGDLDTIVLKALHKDPARRYRSIEKLADDLARFLAGEPVQARPSTVGYRLGKLVRRHRAAMAAAGLAAAALIAATVISLAQARRADDQARRADQQARRADVAAEAARAETARAQAEAERARQAEAQVLAQLELTRAEQDGRAVAEQQARLKSTEVAMTREQLRAALARAEEEKGIAQSESRRAREAEAQAERAAQAEKATRLEVEALYQRELARREHLAARGRQITTRLP